MGTLPNKSEHDDWEGYIEMEREQLAQRATGTMARMIGQALAGESPRELDRTSSKDRSLAQDGYVPLKRGDGVWYKHIDHLSCEDHLARIEYEKELVSWLTDRLQGKIERMPKPLRSNLTGD